MRDKRERWFYSYLPTNMAGGCFDSLLPVFVVVALAGNVGDVALISVAASAASVPALIFWGRFTDSVKWRKHFIVLGFLGRATAYTIMGASVGIGEFMFANILIALLSAASTPAMSILILEIFAKDKWSEKIGLFNNIAGIGNIGGIALGTLWLAFVPLEPVVALRMLFFACAALAMVGAMVALFLIKEPDEKLSRETFHDHVLQLVRWTQERARYMPTKMYRFFRISHIRELSHRHSTGDSYLSPYLVAVFVYTIGATSFFTIQPVWLLSQVGVDKTSVFFLSFAQALASTLLFKKMGQLSDKGDKPRMLVLAKTVRFGLFSLYVLALPIALWNFQTALIYLIILHIAIGVTWAVIADTHLPIAISAGTHQEKGALAGTFNAVLGVGAIAGGAVAGILALAIGYIPSIILSAFFVVIAAIIIKAVVPKEVKMVPVPETAKV
ncbi:MAG: MFS transporter [Euryarchaeota archaeon]|nr:MFS transporter [Euryarchaeota archaeon]